MTSWMREISRRTTRYLLGAFRQGDPDSFIRLPTWMHRRMAWGRDGFSPLLEGGYTLRGSTRVADQLRAICRVLGSYKLPLIKRNRVSPSHSSLRATLPAPIDLSPAEASSSSEHGGDRGILHQLEPSQKLVSHTHPKKIKLGLGTEESRRDNGPLVGRSRGQVLS
ncbi:hypothetical protein BD779DRAFT_1539454 [Infundibulicybe gibba]|nr:hypothetical protein BD779DRAFT_1539454 [Infundibulicybe gibba]